jgi:hypothetical protein
MSYDFYSVNIPFGLHHVTGGEIHLRGDKTRYEIGKDNT